MGAQLYLWCSLYTVETIEGNNVLIIWRFQRVTNFARTGVRTYDLLIKLFFIVAGPSLLSKAPSGCAVGPLGDFGEAAVATVSVVLGKRL